MALMAGRDASALDQVSYWDSRAPGYRWNEIAIAQGLKDGTDIDAGVTIGHQVAKVILSRADMGAAGTGS